MREPWIHSPQDCSLCWLARRLSIPVFNRLDKAYEGTFLLGVETDSQDADGEVVTEKPLPEGLSEEQLIKEMSGFLGDQYQTPSDVFCQKDRRSALIQDGP